MEHVHQQLLTVLNEARLKRHLSPVAVDADSSQSAQELCDSILDSTSADDNEVPAALQLLHARGDIQIQGCVSLTAKFGVPQTSEEDFTQELEARVLQAAIALVAVGCNAPELISVLMDPLVTHVAIGVAAHGEGRVRVTLAPMSRLAHLVTSEHARLLNGGRLVRARLSELEPSSEAAGNAEGTAQAANEEGGASPSASDNTGTFHAEVAVDTPGWIIAGAVVTRHPSSAGAAEEVFKIACDVGSLKPPGSELLLGVSCTLFRSSGAGDGGATDRSADDAGAALLTVRPWELLALESGPPSSSSAASSAAAATTTTSPAGRAEGEGDTRAGTLGHHALLPVAITSALSEALRRGVVQRGEDGDPARSLPQLFCLRVILREEDPDGCWRPIPYTSIDPAFRLTANEHDLLSGDSELGAWGGEAASGVRRTSLTGGGGIAPARDVSSAPGTSRHSRSMTNEQGLLGTEDGGELPRGLGPGGVTLGAASEPVGDRSKRPPQYRVGLEVLVELVDDTGGGAAAGYGDTSRGDDSTAVEDAVFDGTNRRDSVDGEGAFQPISTLLILPVEGDADSALQPAVIAQRMPMELMEPGTAMLPIALGAVTSPPSSAGGAGTTGEEETTTARGSGSKTNSPRSGDPAAAPTAKGRASPLPPIVHMLLVTGHSRQDALAQLPEGYEIASEIDLAALAHASLAATLDGAARDAAAAAEEAAAATAASAGLCQESASALQAQHPGGTGVLGLAPITACVFLGVKREARSAAAGGLAPGEGGEYQREDGAEAEEGEEAAGVAAWEPPVVDAALFVAANMSVATRELLGSHGLAHASISTNGGGDGVHGAPPFPEFAVPDGYAVQVVDLLLPRDSKELRAFGAIGTDDEEEEGEEGGGAGGRAATGAGGEGSPQKQGAPRHRYPLPASSLGQAPIPVRFVLLHTTNPAAAAECARSGMGVQVGGFGGAEEEEADEGRGLGGAQGARPDDGTDPTPGAPGLNPTARSIGRDIRADIQDAEATSARRALLLERIAEALDEGEMLASASSRLQRQLANYFALRASSEDGGAAGAAGGAVPGSSTLGSGAPASSAYATAEKERKLTEAVDAVAAECEVQAAEAARSDASAGGLQRSLDEMGGRLRGISRAFGTFKREIGRTAANSRTGRRIEPAALARFEELEADKDVELGRMQLKHIYLTNQKALKAGGGGKDQLVEGLAVIDFEQLKIENGTLNEQIETRVEEISRLKKKTSGAVQVLTHVREKLHSVDGEAERLRAELRLVEEEVSDQRRTLAAAKLERDRLRTLNESAKAAQSFAHDPALVGDFLARKRAVEEHASTVAVLTQQHASALSRMHRAQEKLAALAPRGAAAGSPGGGGRTTSALR